jgi:hypothetical protein
MIESTSATALSSIIIPFVVKLKHHHSISATTTQTSLPHDNEWFHLSNSQQRILAAGLFQISILPYWIFLVIFFFWKRRRRLRRRNDTSIIPFLAWYGFAFLLIFVFGTILAGNFAKQMYEKEEEDVDDDSSSITLANVDWLHGSAESLLTISNILIVMGFRNSMKNVLLRRSTTNATNHERYFNYRAIMASTIWTMGIFFYMIYGRTHHWEQHASFLGGIGSIPIQNLIDYNNTHEPINALSIPTWTIHWMSVTEYLYAMKLIWQFSNFDMSSSSEPRHNHNQHHHAWKGLTWGMLPLHASSICAVTHHIFYNHTKLDILVTIQAALTLFGNITTAIAAWRIVHSYQTDRSSNHHHHHPRRCRQRHRRVSTTPVEYALDSDIVLWSKILGLPILLAYVVKYGEIILFEKQVTKPNASFAILLVVGIPSIIASYYAFLSWQNGAAEEMDTDEEEEQEDDIMDPTVATEDDDTTTNTVLPKNNLVHTAGNNLERVIVNEQSLLLPSFSV